MKACTVCQMISSKDQCPACGNVTSDNWSGLLIVIDPENSELAHEMKIEIPGEYCLRVR